MWWIQAEIKMTSKYQHRASRGLKHHHMTSLQYLLLRNRVQKGDDYTHTSFNCPTGAFYIGSDDNDLFMRYYVQDLLVGSPHLHLTERPLDIFPVIIDLDFRFPIKSEESLQRRFTLEDVVKFIKIYMSELACLLQMPDNVDIFVMQKPAPVKSKAFVKDGLHFVIPTVVANRAVHHMAREACLPRLADLFASIGTVNSVEDVFDPYVLGRNNWMMYGSCKPGQARYEVTSILRWYKSTGFTEPSPMPRPEEAEFPALLSIRNKAMATPVREDCQQAVAEREHAMMMAQIAARPQHRALGNRINLLTNRIDDHSRLDTIEKLVQLLRPSRADNYDEWMRLGWLLHNTDDRLLNCWVEFSKQSDKYVDGECQSKWERMRNDGNLLTESTLHMWAKEDDLEGYDRVIEEDLLTLVDNSATGFHTDVARVVHRMFKDRFVCCSIRHNKWYEYRCHRWVESDGGCELRRLLSTEVYRKYKDRASHQGARINGNDNESHRNQCERMSVSLRQVGDKLKDTMFKDKILKECREHFYIERFEDKLDANPVLLGFENGVYDLEKHEFRNGRPDDYITFTTGIEYVEYDPNHPVVADIYKFFSQIQPKPHMCSYLIALLASFITGHIIDEKFFIFTGVGSNGKSLTVELFESTLGDYCCKFPVTMLTQKRIASNAANAELARSKGRRFACMQEPSESENLNIGLMKELSGGDKITARGLYSSPVEFKPMFSMVLMCNHLPSCPSDDNGTWRRIRVVEFTSRFLQNPDPNDPMQFPIDLELSKKFPIWRPHFMGMLLEHFRMYQIHGLHEPQEVLATTQNYQRSNDYVADFFADKIDLNVPGTMLSTDEMYSEFKDWWNAENMSGRQPARRDIIAVIERKYGRADRVNGCTVFRNMQVKSAMIIGGT